ncbi:16S rRNA (cytosine(967)-C(5))-methyltransferase RsmB [Pontibacillus yanchengensis]|uniref:16S rRNA (cytosine(967)-C(5))-methyltransferase n=1 Tax=Pontibacillus yanchengensis Y32 TaxID=1385514 RepID=A0A0A2TIN6_9BACI|nr:16S rRNA (cytosine(967)-C(5))-methyltransferase RsmB [Pontibacillus yanchengensis]KGP73941.1 16S rRNA methyltransferase [Pontibacillus yanchengensis Y32]
MSNINVREAALDIVTRVGQQGGYSNLLINQTIHQKGLSQRDTSLLTEIVYGTIQRRDTLDYYISPYLRNKKKLKPWVLWLLYMSCYQLLYLERVPDHAVLNEAVEIAKKRGHKGIVSMVNGVLRNLQRNGPASLDSIEDSIKRLAIETSHPEWLVQRWVDMYGLTVTTNMCHKNLERSTMTVRVNTTKYSREEIIIQLEKEDFEVKPTSLSPQGIEIQSGNIIQHPLFQEGGLTIQDESSMLVGEMIDVEKGMKVLDACSAPGGKATHIAEKMDDAGSVYAYDLHRKKVQLVDQKAEQLGLTCIQTGQYDGRNLSDIHEESTFDRILLDAPCSGLGVVRGKPDIKYAKTEDDINTLSKIQRELLESVSRLLNLHGKLVYSTCTVDRKENEEMIESFLADHPDFEVDPAFFDELPYETKQLVGRTKWGLQLFPQDFDTDGFFLTRLQKRSD